MNFLNLESIKEQISKLEPVSKEQKTEEVKELVLLFDEILCEETVTERLAQVELEKIERLIEIIYDLSDIYNSNEELSSEDYYEEIACFLTSLDYLHKFLQIKKECQQKGKIPAGTDFI